MNRYLITLTILFSTWIAMEASEKRLDIPSGSQNYTRIVVTAGQTIEIPLESDHLIAGDLSAKGEFEPGDVTITDGPGCQLLAKGCTLVITASENSKSYRSVPVVVKESRADKDAIFLLSVIRPGEAPPAEMKISSDSPKMVRLTGKIENQTPAPMTNNYNAVFKQKFFGSGNLSATIEPHGTSTTFYTSSSNGPVYQMINVTNNGGSVTLDTPAISGAGAASFTIDTNSADYAGSPIFCNNAPTLANGESCEIIIKSTLGDPSSAPVTATLTISDGISADTLTFTLTDTTYVYAAGGFNTLGNATVSGGDLLAACTAGTCSNALQGTTGNNYASTNFSVGQWINALAVTATGNLIVGGGFGAIGGATSGATSGTAALLAQCTPGSVVGNACINQISTGATANSYAFNNGYIDGIAAPFSIGGTSYLAVVGDFAQIRSSSVTSGKMIAKCQYSGTSANTTCNNFIGSAASSSKYGNNSIVAIDTLGSSSGSPLVNVGGLFTQIAGYPASAPSSGTTFATCTSGVGGSCSKGMGSDNPNGSILSMTNDGTNLYMGGTFTAIGGYTDSSGGYPLVSCTPAVTTTCSNALASSNDANGRIQAASYSGGSLYVGGRFTTIGGATPVASGNMLAVCTPGGTCSNFVTDASPYATGSDWGGGISAIAIGNQTSITEN